MVLEPCNHIAYYIINLLSNKAANKARNKAAKCFVIYDAIVTTGFYYKQLTCNQKRQKSKVEYRVPNIIDIVLKLEITKKMKACMFKKPDPE